MALSRRAEVFQKKVLEKLFPVPPPGVSSSMEKSTVSRAPVSNQEGSKNTAPLSAYSSLPDKKSETLAPRKMYTVSPPPEDYIPATNTESSNENSESDNDQEVDGPDHAKAISTLFLYWITDILPGKHGKEAECALPSVQN